jgi:hypothetical protein
MKSKFIQSNVHSFWIYQSFGWLIFLAASAAHAFSVPMPNINKFLIQLVETISGLFLTSFLRYFYWNVKYSSFSIFRLIGRIIIFSLITSIIWYLVIIFSRETFFQSGIPKIGNSFGAALGWIDILFPIIFSWSSLYFGIKFWLEWSIQKSRIDEANYLANETKLQMLRYQLNPHFLFNVLNSIRAMINENDSNARSMVTELSEFLRYTLVGKDNKEIPLKEEITAIKHYLSIEKRRFEEKLLISFEVDPKVENYPILSFLLHPLVENAVKYGMKTSKLPLNITIKADEISNGLRLSVINSGSWIEPNSHHCSGYSGTGTGLENVKMRLKYGFVERHDFKYFEKDDNVNVILELFNQTTH